MGAKLIYTDRLSIEELRQLLRYDPETGEFFWLVRKKGILLNKPAGTVRPDGYKQIGWNKRIYFAHLLAFAFTHNRWPANQIDHINQNRMDNRAENLREATGSQNMANRCAHPKNPVGFKGVRLRNNKFEAQIIKGKQYYYLGKFETAKEAAIAYDRKALELFGEYAKLHFS